MTTSTWTPIAHTLNSLNSINRAAGNNDHWESFSGLKFIEQALWGICNIPQQQPPNWKLNVIFLLILWPLTCKFHEGTELLCSPLNTKEKIVSDTEQVQNNIFGKIFCHNWVNKRVSTRLGLKVKWYITELQELLCISLDVRYRRVLFRHAFFHSFILPTNQQFCLVSEYFVLRSVIKAGNTKGHKKILQMISSGLSVVWDTHRYTGI